MTFRFLYTLVTYSAYNYHFLIPANQFFIFMSLKCLIVTNYLFVFTSYQTAVVTLKLINLLVTNELSNPYHLDESIFIVRDIRSIFSLLFYFSMKFI